MKAFEFLRQIKGLLEIIMYQSPVSQKEYIEFVCCLNEISKKSNKEICRLIPLFLKTMINCRSNEISHIITNIVTI